jgi:hypothetical protein
MSIFHIINFKKKKFMDTGVLDFFNKKTRIPLTGVVTRLGWIYRAENVFGSLISTRLILYNVSGVLTNVPFFIP